MSSPMVIGYIFITNFDTATGKTHWVNKLITKIYFDK